MWRSLTELSTTRLATSLICLVFSGFLSNPAYSLASNSHVAAFSSIFAEEASSIGPLGKTQQEKIADQRYNYELAKSAISKKDWDRFAHHYALLGDYPLTPYLDFAILKRDIKKLPFDKIDLFLASNKDTFLAAKAREQVLYELAKQKNWVVYQEYYNHTVEPVDLKCFELQARVQTGDQSAYEEVASIWVSPKSLPKACDPLFLMWRKNQGLTNKIAWERFIQAIKAKNTGLARYIRNQMTGETKGYATQFLYIHAYPYQVKNKKLFYDNSIENQQIIVHGVKRIARRDPKLALRYWNSYESRQLFDEHIALDAKQALAKRLMYKGHVDEAEKLIQASPSLKQADIVQRFIRESLKSQHWDKVLQWISYLDLEQQNSDRWLYWRARAEEALTRHGNPEAAIYQKLAKNRSFYGFLSADILGHPYSLLNHSDKADPSTKQIVSSQGAVRRAKELWLRGNMLEAQAEWLYGTRNMSPKELKAAGTLASEWGWYNKGIMAMISGGHWNHLDVRFPLAYQNEIEKVSTKTNVEVPLLYAITRQESAFREEAKSHAGAMGLMQLLPSTAKQTARKNGMKINKSDLLEPETNLALGGHYISELLNKFNGNRILAAAAYNAGPHRVSRWLNDKSLVPFDIWIETIPFHETRGYVQNILAFSVIYAQKLGHTSPFITEQEATREL